jgi:hypothetical protein
MLWAEFSCWRFIAYNHRLICVVVPKIVIKKDLTRNVINWNIFWTEHGKANNVREEFASDKSVTEKSDLKT